MSEACRALGKSMDAPDMGVESFSEIVMGDADVLPMDDFQFGELDFD